MKNSSINRFSAASLAAICFSASISFTPQAGAVNFYWDSNGTTSGAGTTPTGTWGTDVFWNTNSAGTVATAATPTTSVDSLFFSAGTDAVDPYTVTVNGSQASKSLTLEDGTPTLTGGTIILGAGGGITLAATTITGATISSHLTITGDQTLNIAADRALTLDTGTFTRNAGATLNVHGSGTVTSTQTNLSANSATGIIGRWASFGTAAATQYATFSGSTITGLTGTPAADGLELTDTTGLLNYDLATFGGIVADTVSANTIRYSGAAGTTAPGATSFTVNGLMNAGTGVWTIGTAALTIGVDKELVVNTANNGITISGSIQDNGGGISGLTKTGTGILALSGANAYTGTTIINAGTLQVGAAGATGTLGGGSVTNNSILAFNRSGSLTVANNISGGGTVTFSLGTFTLSGANTYTGATSFSTSATIGVSSLNSVVGGTASSNLGAPTTAGNGTITFGGGNAITSKIIYTGSGETTDRAISIVTGGAGSTTTLDQSGTGLLRFTGAITRNGNLTNSLILQGSTDGTGEISGVISVPAGLFPVTKQGTGTWTLSGTNTYTSATTLTAGTLSVSTIGNGGVAGNLGKATNAAGNIVFNGGTLKHTGASDTSDRAFTINAGKTATIDTTNDLTLAGATGAATTGFLTKIGVGTLALTGANTHTGATTVSQGTLALPSGSMASPITVNNAAFLGFTVGSPITSTSSVTLDSGAKIKIRGTPVSPASYTLLTADLGISGTPVLDAAITGYTLALVSGNTVLKLNYTGGGSNYVSWANDPTKGNIPGEPASGDFDNDGLSNLTEYALGKNPRISSQPAGDLLGNVITYTKGSDAIANGDVSWVIETSETLANDWAPAVTQPAGDPALTISYTFNPGTPAKKFARLKVTQN